MTGACEVCDKTVCPDCETVADLVENTHYGEPTCQWCLASWVKYDDEYDQE